MNVRFTCPNCDCPAKATLPGAESWQCHACDQRLTPHALEDQELPGCVVCGCRDLYRKKDFPHNLGMTILVIACVVSFITYGLYEKWLTWAILIGTAVFDGLLYLLVGDVVVCHRCHAHYRGLPKEKEYPPFDLGIAERYRQERIRKHQLQSEQSLREHK